MRLKKEEINQIKSTGKKCFGTDAEIYLFGSRTDDKKRGGDIDLYIETKAKEKVFDKKVRMIRLLYEKLGEQKIDVVVNNFSESLYIYQVAKKEGILL